MQSKWDFFFNKMLPKKFIVFTIATIALFMKLLNGQQWTIVAGIYIGGNVLKTLFNGIGAKNEYRR